MHLTRQARLVRDHLYSNAHLTSWQAEGVYRIRRLASRIDELRKAGFDIEKEVQKDATGQRYTRYSFSRRQKRRRTPLNPAAVPTRKFELADIRTAYRRYCNNELGLTGSDLDSEVDDFIKAAQETFE